MSKAKQLVMNYFARDAIYLSIIYFNRDRMIHSFRLSGVIFSTVLTAEIETNERFVCLCRTCHIS